MGFSYDPKPLIEVSLEDVWDTLAKGASHALREWTMTPGSPLPTGFHPGFTPHDCVLLFRIRAQTGFSVLGGVLETIQAALPGDVCIRVGAWVDDSLTDDAVPIRALFVG